jgi:hypothetical protein
MKPEARVCDHSRPAGKGGSLETLASVLHSSRVSGLFTNKHMSEKLFYPRSLTLHVIGICLRVAGGAFSQYSSLGLLFWGF